MQRVGHGDAQRARRRCGAALVHAAGRLDAVRLQPRRNLEIADHLGMELAREPDGVTDVVGVAVRDQDRVQPVEAEALGESGIALEERVDDDDFAGIEAELERAVAEPGDREHEMPSEHPL